MARDGVHQNQTLQEIGMLADFAEDAEAIEDSCGVGRELQSCADLRKLRSLFDDVCWKTRLGKRERGSKSANATANDEKRDSRHYTFLPG